MNNKGFAITTILYGLLVLFCFLLTALLGILYSYKSTQEKLVDEVNGARNLISGTIDNTAPPSSSGSSNVASSDAPSSSAVSHTLTYHCNGGKFYGGSNITWSTSYVTGQAINLEEDGCLWSGHSFVGWHTRSNASASEVLSSLNMPDSNLTI